MLHCQVWEQVFCGETKDPLLYSSDVHFFPAQKLEFISCQVCTRNGRHVDASFCSFHFSFYHFFFFILFLHSSFCGQMKMRGWLSRREIDRLNMVIKNIQVASNGN